MADKEPLIKTANMTDEEWAKLESLVAEYQEKNPDWERTGFETIEDMEKLIAGETLTSDREKAEKAFEEADIANANKRAEELRKYAIEYQNALRQVTYAKLMLKNVVKQAEKDNFSKWQLESIVYAMNVQEGFERLVLEEASKPYNPERPETKTDDSEKPNCDEEPMRDSENELVNDEDDAEEGDINV